MTAPRGKRNPERKNRGCHIRLSRVLRKGGGESIPSRPSGKVPQNIFKQKEDSLRPGRIGKGEVQETILKSVKKLGSRGKSKPFFDGSSQPGRRVRRLLTRWGILH